MGANDFFIISSGKTAAEAFDKAVERAQWENGHGGYTGTIAEKHSFVMIPDSAEKVAKALEAKAAKPFSKEEHWDESYYKQTVGRIKTAARKLRESPDPADPGLIANALLEADDPRISDKWGPAGCIQIEKGRFLFFGWASS